MIVELRKDEKIFGGVIRMMVRMANADRDMGALSWLEQGDRAGHTNVRVFGLHCDPA
jgi:hypothetical protein